MKEFAGILFTLKKRVQNIVENDLQYYKYTLFANYVQTECQFRYCGTAIPFLTVRSTAR